MKGLEYDNPTVVFPDDHNLAVLGHELRNVLNGLLGMAELLAESGLKPDQVRWLRAIQQSGRQMESLIRYVWAYNTVNEPGIMPRRERVDGMEMLEQIVISHTPNARLAKNQLVLVVDPEMPRYWMLDACLVRQLLDNLVGNAMKFTKRGKIMIEVTPEGGKGEKGGSIRFQVRDTGRGFDELEAKDIFGAYRRFGDSQNGRLTNRGLGLYICQNIVHAMRGEIDCDSSEAGGSRFRVSIPGALNRHEAHGFILPSSLLTPLFCQLQLGRPLRRSVGNFLSRLGVRFCDVGVTPCDQNQNLVISEIAHPGAEHLTSLLLAPVSPSADTRHQKVLDMPVLESVLESVLLEIALEWRSRVVRNENRGSAPRQR